MMSRPFENSVLTSPATRSTRPTISLITKILKIQYHKKYEYHFPPIENGTHIFFMKVHTTIIF